MPETPPGGSDPSAEDGRQSARGDRRGLRWLVVIESAAGGAREQSEFETLRRLVGRLQDWHATGLYCGERYAVQLEVEADSWAEALRLGMAAHHEAVDDLEVTRPSLLRAQVLVPDETPDGPSPDSDEPLWDVRDEAVPAAVYHATRALLGVATEAEIRAKLEQFVIGCGGAVVKGPVLPQPGVIVEDLGLAPGDEVYATADAISVAGMMIELSLPHLVEDARRAWQRLRRQWDLH